LEQDDRVLKPDLERIKVLWRDLTEASSGFAGNGLTIAGSDTHRASPPGWTGIVELQGDVVVACPVNRVEWVRRTLTDVRPDRLIEPRHVDRLLHPTDTIGPALLFYGRISTPRPPTPTRVIGPLDIADPRVRAVFEATSQAERDETGFDETTSGAYVALGDDGNPASVCGWSEWPHLIAQMSSFTAMPYRRKGYGRVAAMRALEAACERDLLPQWRAAHRNSASIALAHRLGLVLVGHQYSVTFDHNRDDSQRTASAEDV
jgi:RimJ/RimL family protein N-acetyltransferase